MNFWDRLNRNARIRTRETKNKKLRTETHNREDGFDAAITTTKRGNSTNMFIDFDGGAINGGESVRMTGGQARTLFRLLAKHYGYVGKSFSPVKSEIST